MAVPSVVIAGRPNVGKSSLFNAIYGSRVAIVEETPGVTRDRITRIVERNGVRFELVDTGGLGLVDREELAEHVDMQIQIAIHQADLVLLVVDAKTGVQPVDEQIANELRDVEKKVLVVVNKCDNQQDEMAAADFYALGHQELVRVSALHRRGIGHLLERLAEELPEAEPEPEQLPREPVKIAFVGRRNAGKSTLVNYLAQEPRVVVSETPGTTRDSVDVYFRMDEMEFTAIDTAGLRRRKQIKDAVDYYSAARTHRAIRRADVVAHLLDAPMEISRLDKQIADEVSSGYKPCVVAVNKIDLAPPDVTDEDWEAYVRDRLPGLSLAPMVCISALTGRNVVPLVETCVALHQQSFVRVPTGALNRALEEAGQKQPPPSSGASFGKIYYATQVAVQPPTIVLFVNEPELIGDGYLRYLANHLRTEFPFNAIPLKFKVRARRREQQA
ncbi:MAG: ribosome biogenesis GTPase Der [Planctomycetota bacterium]